MFACLVILSTAASLAASSPPAQADGDPASDYFYFHTLYTPIGQRIPAAQLHDLQRSIDGAAKAGFPIHVALILDRTDLGSVPQLLGHQQHYAQLLAGEDALVFRTPILVVLPTGAAVSNITPAGPARALVGRIPIARPVTASSLALAATVAVRKLAAASGHPIAQSSDDRAKPVAIGSAIGALAVLAIAVALLRRRRSSAA